MHDDTKFFIGIRGHYGKFDFASRGLFTHASHIQRANTFKALT